MAPVEVVLPVDFLIGFVWQTSWGSSALTIESVKVLYLLWNEGPAIRTSSSSQAGQDDSAIS